MIAQTPHARILLALLSTLLVLPWDGLATGEPRVAFYFAAHQDDWQLFMNPNAYHDVQRPSAKVVFVYFTAGDAGAGLGRAGRARPYYLARENGAKVSVQFMADANTRPDIGVDSVASLRGHPVSKWRYRHTVSYFLRLPDGNPEGTGYETTGFQTLKRLRDAAIPSMTAIDDSTSYEGWTDLKDSLRQLIDDERGTVTNVWIHVPDTDLETNTGDHADHQHVARAVLEAIPDLPWIHRVFYLTYVTAELEVNMNATDREIEAGTFGALVAGLAAFDHGSAWDPLHRSWLSRHYYRVEPGTGQWSP